MKIHPRNMRKRVYILFAVLSFSQIVFAQSNALLTLQEAVRIGIEQNFAIQVVRNDAQIARLNNNLAAAGMLPNYALTYATDNQISNSNQEYLSGAKNSKSNAKSSQTNAAVELTWTVFDGLKMFATHNRLIALEEIGELRLRQQMELWCNRIIKAYLDVVIAQKQLHVYTETLQLSETRLALAKLKYESGKSPKTEWLQARVDYNTDRYNRFNQEGVLRNARAGLNQLLAREHQQEFRVEDEIHYSDTLSIAERQQQIATNNASYLIAIKNQEVNRLVEKELASQRLPTIKLNAGYQDAKSTSQAGFLQTSSSYGPHYGFSVAYSFFNGLDLNRKIAGAKLNQQSAMFIANDTLLRIQTLFRQTATNFETAKQLVEFEQENYAIARENNEISEEQYKAGAITGIELRQAQLNLQQSRMRLVNAQYTAKLNEIEINRLSGKSNQ